jgi:hypothetical protein
VIVGEYSNRSECRIAASALGVALGIECIPCMTRRMQKAKTLLGIFLVVVAIQTAYTTSDAVLGPDRRDPWM